MLVEGEYDSIAGKVMLSKITGLEDGLPRKIATHEDLMRLVEAIFLAANEYMEHDDLLAERGGN